MQETWKGLKLKRSARPVLAPRDKIRARTPKIPAFFEDRDEMDSEINDWFRLTF